MDVSVTVKNPFNGIERTRLIEHAAERVA